MQDVDAAGLGIGEDYPTRVMGVLNVSAESPYEPSVFADPGAAAEYVDRELVDEGADIVDVGLESANKRFDVLSADEELDRLDAALEAVASVSGDPVFSIETRYHEVAATALDGGFDMVNDVCGFADPELPRVCDERDAAVVKMASPPDLGRPGAVGDVDWPAARGRDVPWPRGYADDVYDALASGELTDKTLVDPAFGGWSEAKTLADDRETFERLREFRGLGRPVLVSINRKNFLRELAGRDTEAALPVSLAATALAVERGAHVVRTHDVAETVDAVAVGDRFAAVRFRDPDAGVAELDVTTSRETARHLDRVGSDADPDAAATRVFELTGLADGERETLSDLVAARREVTLAVGPDGTLLLGTVAGIERLARASDDDRVDGRLSSIRASLE